MATNPDAITMTVAEFLRFEGEPDRRYELVDGRLRMMAALSGEHGTIVGNCWGEIDRRLERRPPCRAQIDAGIRIDDATFYVADVALTCNPEPRSQITREPVLIVEVLSTSTRTDDKGRKLDPRAWTASARSGSSIPSAAACRSGGANRTVGRAATSWLLRASRAASSRTGSPSTGSTATRTSEARRPHAPRRRRQGANQPSPSSVRPFGRYSQPTQPA